MDMVSLAQATPQGHHHHLGTALGRTPAAQRESEKNPAFCFHGRL